MFHKLFPPPHIDLIDLVTFKFYHLLNLCRVMQVVFACCVRTLTFIGFHGRQIFDVQINLFSMSIKKQIEYVVIVLRIFLQSNQLLHRHLFQVN